MDLTVVETALVAIAPSIVTIITTISGIIAFFRQFKKQKKESDNKLLECNTRLEKAYNDIATMKAKIETIEKCLIELKEKK